MPIIKELNIPPSYNIVLTLNIKLAHKIFNLESPKSIQETLDLKYTQNSFSTRNTSLKLLVRPYVRTTNFGYKSTKNQTVIQWNMLQSNKKMLILLLVVPP